MATSDQRDGATAGPRCVNGVTLRCELPSDHEGDCKVNVMVNLDSVTAVNDHSALVEKMRALRAEWLKRREAYADCEEYDGDNHGDSQGRGIFETLVSCDDHEFKEVYYGHECVKCHLFFAFRCAPWDEEPELYSREARRG